MEKETTKKMQKTSLSEVQFFELAKKPCGKKHRHGGEGVGRRGWVWTGEEKG